MEKSPERLKILEKIDELERNERWDIDVEDDPETKELLPDQIDYLDKKLSSKLKTFFANIIGQKFYENLIKKNQLIIKEVRGIENYTQVKTGAILTCNHFSVCDNYAIFRVIRPYMKRGQRLYKVIREGNYTNPPPAFGCILRNCNTLPLSKNTSTMKKFLKSIDVLLKRGEKVLVYPEQAMWWNYRKPRPLKNGAFSFAFASDVPVIPVFITMEDSGIYDPDGFFVQAYTIHFLPPIYPDRSLSKAENVKLMKEKNYKMWVETYEKVYGKPLKYLTKEDKGE